jgi:hypothetical protein
VNHFFCVAVAQRVGDLVDVAGTDGFREAFVGCGLQRFVTGSYKKITEVLISLPR